MVEKSGGFVRPVDSTTGSPFCGVGCGPAFFPSLLTGKIAGAIRTCSSPEVCSALLFFSGVQEVLRIGQPEGLVDLALGRLVFFALLVLTVITAFLKLKLL
jgi:hypothetical protein